MTFLFTYHEKCIIVLSKLWRKKVISKFIEPYYSQHNPIILLEIDHVEAVFD